MDRSFQFRIYPTGDQESQINDTFGCCRFIYNYFLQKTKERWETERRNYTYFEWYKDLKPLKRENVWLYNADSHALVNSMQNLNSAYQRFFREVRKKIKPHYPLFKSKKNPVQSYRTSNCNGVIRVERNKIRLPKIGWVYCRNSYGMDYDFGKIINATVKKAQTGEYYVSIYAEGVGDVIYEKTGATIGIDVGIKNIAVLSNGTKYDVYLSGDEYDRKLALLQRRLSRKTKGGRNWEKQRKKLARYFGKNQNRRNDYYHKITTGLVKAYDIICLEDLSLISMKREKTISKLIQDAGIYEFKRQLIYKCRMHGKEVKLIDRFYPSSQLCSSCGYKNSSLRHASIREWNCPVCGEHHDRDVNAAVNILMKATGT